MNQPKWTLGGGQVVFPYLAKQYGLKTFIETGVGNGGMIAFMHPVFEHVYSIENNQWNFDLATALFTYVPNVNILFGDSAEVLPELLGRLPKEPTFFWLDAHGKPGTDDGPLASEIASVMKFRPDALIAIDDVGQSTHHDINLSSVRNAGVPIDNWKQDYRFSRVMFMHQGQYNIPTFE